MRHAKAKNLLATAATADQLQGAVAEAINLGMPLFEVEEYLDRLDAVRALLKASRVPVRESSLRSLIPQFDGRPRLH
jgi:hypothetical protein